MPLFLLKTCPVLWKCCFLTAMGKKYILVVVTILIGLGVGCGVKKATHQRALDEVMLLQGQLDQEKTNNDEWTAKWKAAEKDILSKEAAREQALDDLQKANLATKQELEELRKQRAAAEARLEEFRQLNKRFRSLVDTGKLQVSFRHGQMILNLPSSILFASGRAKLTKDGQVALGEVLAILKEFQDRLFLIGGHTDNVPIRSSRFPNNWYLSAARAVSVVEFMVSSGFPSKKLGAVGYGEFSPSAPNDTAANKALNRRIEIVLVPDLSGLAK